MPFVALLAIILVSGCDNDIDPDTLVRELRVLALRIGDATPGSAAELQANVGGTLQMPTFDFTQPSVTMTVLAAAPTGPGRRISTQGARPLQYDFFACIGPLSLFSPGTLDRDCLKFAPGDPPARQNKSLLPLVPMPIGNASLVLQTDSLKAILGQFLGTALSASAGSANTSGGDISLPSRPLTLLLPILVEVSVPPPAGDVSNPLDREIGYSFLQVVVAFPALGMSLPPPNHNPFLPTLGAVKVGPASMNEMAQLVPCPNLQSGDCTSYPITRSDPLFLTAMAAPGAVETYTPLDDSGRKDVVETLRYTWFSTDGIFENERTGDARPETKWTNADKRPAPESVSKVDLWLIVQDGRGGTDFQHFQLSF